MIKWDAGGRYRGLHIKKGSQNISLTKMKSVMRAKIVFAISVIKLTDTGSKL